MASEQRHEDDGGAPAALEAAPEAAADAADKLLSEYERQTADVKARAEVWQRHLEDYNDLKGRVYFWTLCMVLRLQKCHETSRIFIWRE